MVTMFMMYMLISHKTGWGITWYDWLIFALLFLGKLASTSSKLPATAGGTFVKELE